MNLQQILLIEKLWRVQMNFPNNVCASKLIPEGTSMYLNEDMTSEKFFS